MKVAAVQLNSTADRAANLAGADRLTRAAVADGAKLIVLPEKWSAIGSEEDLRAGAEELGGASNDRGGSGASRDDRGGSGGSGASSDDRGGSADGPAIAWARAIARELRVDLVAGSIAERVPGREKLANTSVHVDPRGEIKAVYRKVHMFDVEIDGRSYRESELEEPGEEIVLSQTADGVDLGLSICYDLRFPELFRTLGTVDLLVIPAAFTETTGRAHWELLLRARAVENQCYVLASAQGGVHPTGRRTWGDSMLVDPWGVVLARLAKGEGVVAGELDPARIAEVRNSLPTLKHRKL